MDRRIKRLLETTDQLYDKNDEILNRLDEVCDDRVVKTEHIGGVHSYAVLKINDDDGEFQYHAIRRLNKDMQYAIFEYIKLHPDATVLLKFAYNPNPVKLYHLVKEQLENKIEWYANNFKLKEHYTESQLIADITEIHNSRFSTQ